MSVALPSLRSFLAEAGGSVVVRGIGAFSIAAVQLGVAALIGVGEYGLYSYVIAWVTLLATVAALGTETSTVRITTELVTQEAWGAARRFAGYAVTIIGLAGGLVALLCLGILGALDPVFAELPRLALVAAFLFVPASAMLQALFGVAQGARAPVLGQVPNLVIRPLVMALMIVVLVAARGRDAMDASATLIAEVVASIVAVACAMALIRRNLGRRPGALEDSRTLRRALNAAPALLVLSLAQMLIWYAGQLALGLTASPVEVGAYSAAARLTMLIAIAITAVNSIVAPRIAELYFRREMRSLDRLVAQAAAVSTAIALPAACVLVLGGKWLLNLLGTGFSQGYPVLVALTLGQCVNAATGSVLYVMTMTGHERQAAILVGVTACVNLLVCLTLASVFGATSVAVATACAIALWNLAAVRWVRTNIGLECALRLSKRIRFA